MIRFLQALAALPRWGWVAGAAATLAAALVAAFSAHVAGERQDARDDLRAEQGREAAETARDIRNDQIRNDADAAARDLDGWLRDPDTPFLLAPGSLRGRQAGADDDAP